MCRMGGARVASKAVSSIAPVDAIEVLEMSGNNGETKRPHGNGHGASPQDEGTPKKMRTDAASPAARREDKGATDTPKKLQGIALRVEDICSDDWHRHFEELRRVHPPRSRARLPTDVLVHPPSEDELLSTARRACTDGTDANWEALTLPAKLPRINTVAAVVRRLTGPEAVIILSTCAERYRLHPRERPLCAAWILQVVENRASILVGRSELTVAVRGLLQFLEPSAMEQPLSSQVRSCIGGWRLASELAKKSHRRKAAPAKAAPAGKAAATGAATGGAAKDEESSEVEGEDEDASDDDEAADGGSDDS